MSSPHIAGSAILDQGAAPGLDARRDQVGPDDDGDHQRRQGGPRHPGRPVRPRCGPGRPDQGRCAADRVRRDTADNMFALGQRPAHRTRREPASVNVPTMPGTVTVTRTATNVSGKDYDFDVSTRLRRARRSRSRPTTVGSSPDEPDLQDHDHLERFYRASTSARSASPPGTCPLHLPVAFFNQQGDVTLSQSCDPTASRARRRPAPSRRRTTPAATAP